MVIIVVWFAACASDFAGAQNAVRKMDPSTWSNPSGKYSVVKEVEQTLPGHTVYRPSALAAFPSQDNLPVVVMSGPDCDYGGDSFRPFLTEIASHGYLVIALGEPVPEGKRASMFYNKASDLLQGIDWAFAENERKDGKYCGKIDTTHVVLMGHSFGGQLVSRLVDDPRVTLIAMWNSGIIPYTSSKDGALANPRDTRFATNNPDLAGGYAYSSRIKVPIAYFVGENDILRPNSLHDFNEVQDAPAFYAVRDISGDANLGTFRETNGGAWGEAGAAWLDWWCKDDINARDFFYGAPCGLERSSEKWIEVRKKNIDYTDSGGQAIDWPNYRRYERADDTLSKNPTAVLMGDSITDNWANEDPDFFSKNNFAGRGISGQTVSQMICRFRQDVVNLHPKLVVINGGTNDLCQGLASMAYYPENTIIDNIKSMCEIARANNIKVILTSITPCEHYMPIPDIDAGSRIVEINKRLKAYADSRKDIEWLDYFTPLANDKNGFNGDQSYDGVHPVITVYRTMEKLLTDAIAKSLKTENNYYVIPMEKAVEIKAKKDAEHAAMPKFSPEQVRQMIKAQSKK